MKLPLFSFLHPVTSAIIVVVDVIIIIIIGTTALYGSWPALKTFFGHPALMPLFSN
jgi:hypothetical protein